MYCTPYVEVLVLVLCTVRTFLIQETQIISKHVKPLQVQYMYVHYIRTIGIFGAGFVPKVNTSSSSLSSSPLLVIGCQLGGGVGLCRSRFVNYIMTFL